MAFISIRDLFYFWKSWRDRKNPVRTLPQRFLRIFSEHDIEQTQIPRLLGPEFGISVADLTSDERLVAKLTEPLLDHVCELFGIRRQWIDGEDESIYSGCGFYKDYHGFLGFVEGLQKQSERITFFVLKSIGHDLADKQRHDIDDLAVVFRISIGWIGDKEIFRYIPFDDNYPWGHRPARIFLKAMCLICWQFKIHPACVEVSAEAIPKVLSGTYIPHRLLKNLTWAKWHLDDYIVTNAESHVAKDEEEALEVREELTQMKILARLPKSTDGRLGM